MSIAPSSGTHSLVYSILTTRIKAIHLFLYVKSVPASFGQADTVPAFIR